MQKTDTDRSYFDLVELIFDAALTPAAWDVVNKKFAGLMKSQATGLFLQDTATNDFIDAHLTGFDQKKIEEYGSHYAAVNPWITVPGLMSLGRILSDESIDEIEGKIGAFHSTEFYSDWMRPQSFEHSMGSSIDVSSSLQLNYTFFRSKSLGAYSRNEIALFKRIVPLLSKSAKISKVIAGTETRIQAGSTVLDQLPTPIFHLNSQQKIIQANRRARALLSENTVLSEKYGKLSVVDTIGNTLYKNCVKDLLSSPHAAGYYTFEVSCNSTGKKAHCTLFPYRGHHVSNLVQQPQLMLIVDMPILLSSAHHRYWQEKFGFTPQESQVVQRLLQNKPLKEISTELEISYETVRWYLKEIFYKSNVSRQQDLVQKLCTDITVHFID